MNWIDLGILIILGISIIISFARGFAKETLSLLAWIVAGWVAIRFSEAFAAMLLPYIEEPAIRYAVAFISLFALVLIGATIIKWVVSWFLYATELSFFDRVLGIVFGAARGGIIISVMLFLGSVTSLQQTEYWKTSSLLPWFKPYAFWLVSFLPEPEHFADALEVEQSEENRPLITDERIRGLAGSVVSNLSTLMDDETASEDTQIAQSDDEDTDLTEKDASSTKVETITLPKPR